MEELYTVNQVAIILKVHPLSVRRYINEGKLRAVKVGGNVRVSQTDLRNFTEGYLPRFKQPTKQLQPVSDKPFSPADAIFRLKGRGLSLENYQQAVSAAYKK